MSIEKLEKSLNSELETLIQEGRYKAPERIINAYIPATKDTGPRYTLKNYSKNFIRMNSNSYLSLFDHPSLISAADKACKEFGVGPGAVRFIDGTFVYHIELETRIANFLNKPAAKIFSSAYTANCGLALALTSPKTYWIGDELNHNSIIRAMRIAGVPSSNKAIYQHNNIKDLERCLQQVPSDMQRVIVIFDGIFSMRGDPAPVDTILELTALYDNKFKDGVITIIDDSHGIGAYGDTGRGTMEYKNAWPDIIVGTFGKSFGVNGGFIASTERVIEIIRQKADTYIYTNPLSVADCAASIKAIDICDSPEGKIRLSRLKHLTKHFRDGLKSQGWESIEGPHPIVPLLIRDTQRAKNIINHLFDCGVLATGLTYPVVPKGSETIRFQINAAHTDKDIEDVLSYLNQAKNKF